LPDIVASLFVSIGSVDEFFNGAPADPKAQSDHGGVPKRHEGSAPFLELLVGRRRVGILPTRIDVCVPGLQPGGRALELDDLVDEFLRWPFRAGAPMNSRREKPPIFASLERLVESQQGFGLQDDRELWDSARRHEQ
jgi:hypothetical protein